MPKPVVMVGRMSTRGDSTDLLRSLMTHLTTGHVTPILGLGMTDSLVGSRRELAREWVRSFEFLARAIRRISPTSRSSWP